MQGLLLAGRYRLGESIGRGGMGRVWRAQDEVLHRAVAVKELTAAQFVQEADRAVLFARTQTEARAAARINHPAVVTVHDVVQYDDRPWIVMELVVGRSLADAVKDDGRVDPVEAARIGLWTLKALRAAHAAGVLHRDVKPGNVLLADDRRILLTDFGIAAIEGDSTITRTGEVVGSVDYLAPERVSGANPGPASDLWALGATLYTAVEGNSPFRRTSPLGTMQAVVTEEPSPPEHAGALAPIISALLSKDPAARPSAEDAEAMLAEAAEGRRPHQAQAYVPTQVHPSAGTPGGTSAGTSAGTYGQGQTPTAYGQGQTSTAHPQQQQGHGHTVVGGTGSDGASSRERRRWPARIALVVVAALLGGAGVFGYLHYADEGSGAGAGAGADDGGPGTDVGGIPKEWKRVNDPAGFSLRLPKNWNREVDGSQIDYTPDGGRRFLRIGVDRAPTFDSPYTHQLALEKGLRVKLPAYKRLDLNSNTFRDRPGALWQFSWTAGANDTTAGPRRAISQTYISRDGVEYAIYMSAPAQGWETTREQFDAMLQGWRERKVN
ncbi:serine/threonine-protein kinase [Streptomyces kanamyceticus]|uniref:non-specific serine/threonine protein kinase n=1 Tax=Streptomyces kanamyceticus TaxID=1967 RepID=A0A5J6GBC1_STRKN|nr:serine/threonine-protein kinase [Streptomyces kanamyceticus]QEU92373.1 serine/threonine protein kinase [Streptomyces kanamyceticus]